jgi:hypothetical protein
MSVSDTNIPETDDNLEELQFDNDEIDEDDEIDIFEKDYEYPENDIILEDDTIDIEGLLTFEPNKPLYIVLNHADGTSDTIQVNHTYNEQQIEWFKAGGALNVIRSQFAKV